MIHNNLPLSFLNNVKEIPVQSFTFSHICKLVSLKVKVISEYFEF